LIIDLSNWTVTFDSRCCIILSMCQYWKFTNDSTGERIMKIS